MPAKKLLRARRSFSARVGRKERFVKEGELRSESLQATDG